MSPRRWQVVLGVAAAGLIVVALTARMRRHGAMAPLDAGAGRGVPRDAGAARDGGALHEVRGAVIDARGNRVARALVTILAAHSDAAVAAGARAVWRQQGELGIYSGPMPSARVGAKMPPAVAWSARTDGQGSFVVAGIPAGLVIVVAEHPTAGRGEVEATAGGSAPRELVVRLEPLPPPPDGGAGAEVGVALPPVPVLVRDARTRAIITGARVTFANGQVHVRAGGYAPADVALPADAREVEVDLELAASVAGRVLDERGDPVAGAEVQAGGAAVRTDARGEFHLTGVKPGDVTIAAQSGGRQGATALRVLPGERRHDADVRLR